MGEQEEEIAIKMETSEEALARNLAAAEHVMAEVEKNAVAMAALDETLRSAIFSFCREKEKRDLEEATTARKVAEAKEAIRRRSAKEYLKERNDLLCIGDWGERVPFQARFALCTRTGKRFVGCPGQEKDLSMWKDIPEYCAVDLVRGFTGPYWGYYSEQDDSKVMSAYYNSRILPILDAIGGDEEWLLTVIRKGFGVFSMEGRDLSDPFGVIKYMIDSAGMVVVKSIGEKKTLEEHQEELKMEFCDGTSEERSSEGEIQKVAVS